MRNGGGWRYQAIYSDNDDENRIYSICEVYLDDTGKLEAWTENQTIAPLGENINELTGDLRLMLDDVTKWKAVPFDSLQVGMTFQHR